VHYIYYTLQLYIYEIAAFAAMTVGVSSYSKIIENTNKEKGTCSKRIDLKDI